MAVLELQIILSNSRYRIEGGAFSTVESEKLNSKCDASL